LGLSQLLDLTPELPEYSFLLSLS